MLPKFVHCDATLFVTTSWWCHSNHHVTQRNEQTGKEQGQAVSAWANEKEVSAPPAQFFCLGLLLVSMALL